MFTNDKNFMSAIKEIQMKEEINSEKRVDIYILLSVGSSVPGRYFGT